MTYLLWHIRSSLFHFSLCLHSHFLNSLIQLNLFHSFVVTYLLWHIWSHCIRCFCDRKFTYSPKHCFTRSFNVTYLLWHIQNYCSTSAMLRYYHFVKKSMQAVQTWSNSNSMHVDVRHKTEQRFIAFLISYASCTCVCDISIGILLQIFTGGGKTCHVRDVALLPFRQEIDASRTNLIK